MIKYFKYFQLFQYCVELIDRCIFTLVCAYLCFVLVLLPARTHSSLFNGEVTAAVFLLWIINVVSLSLKSRLIVKWPIHLCTSGTIHFRNKVDNYSLLYKIKVIVVERDFRGFSCGPCCGPQHSGVLFPWVRWQSCFGSQFIFDQNKW